MSLPSLSVVIPVFNEPEWIGRTVTALADSVRAAGIDDGELVVVDDGSAAPTQAALAALDAAPMTLRVVRQDNAGRFAARANGIRAATGSLVLLIDARIALDADALRWVSQAWTPDRAVWNGHVDIDKDGNPYARFWDTLTTAAFRDYFLEPRTTSFGLEDYDRFPKGTGHLLAPRALLLEALEGFRSHYEDLRFSSDDTHMLRHVAGRQPINISPRFRSTYRSRTNLRQFLRHAHHRGTTFFDGFARRDSRFFGVLVAIFPASLAAPLMALRRPRAALAALAAVPAAAFTVATLWLRRPWRDAVAFGALTPPFALVYVLGVWRGALLWLRARASR